LTKILCALCGDFSLDKLQILLYNTNRLFWSNSMTMKEKKREIILQNARGLFAHYGLKKTSADALLQILLKGIEVR